MRMATGTWAHPVGPQRTQHHHFGHIAWTNRTHGHRNQTRLRAHTHPLRKGHASVLRHAVCVTGLEREYSEIRTNVRKAIFGLLNRSAAHTDVRVFGVRPPNDNWTNVLSDLPFQAVGMQNWSFCYPQDIELPFWFTCSRGGKTTRMGMCTRSFMQVRTTCRHAASQPAAEPACS